MTDLDEAFTTALVQLLRTIQNSTNTSDRVKADSEAVATLIAAWVMYLRKVKAR